MFHTAREILERFDTLAPKRQFFETEWQECADHLFGRREFTTVRTPTRRTRELLDTTAKQSLTQLAGGLQGLLADPATPWFSIMPESESESESEPEPA